MKEKINAAYFSTLDVNKEPYILNEGINRIVIIFGIDSTINTKLNNPVLLFSSEDIEVYHVFDEANYVIKLLEKLKYPATLIKSSKETTEINASDIKEHLAIIAQRVVELKSDASTTNNKKLTIFEFAFEIENLIQVKNNYEKAIAIGYYYSKYLELDFDLKSTIEYIESDNEVGGYHE